MASPVIEKFWNDLVSDIKSNRISLPALPEIVHKTRRMLDQGKATSNQVSKVISSDVIMTTRMLRLVNSPLYRSRRKIEDVKTAITRLGNQNVRSVVTSLSMEQLYNKGMAKQVRDALQKNWEHSSHVASLSYLIARDYTPIKPLDPDEAMLAGLIHDIGALPILEYAEMVPDLMINPKALKKVLEVLHTRVGKLVLQSWGFSEQLISVASEHEDLMRDPDSPDPDYTDVVIVANLLSYIGTMHPHARRDWSLIPAFRRLAMTPDESIDIIHNARDEINEIRQVFL